MDAKKMIVRIAQRMDEKNLTNAFEGNVSVMEGGLLYITPSGQNKGCIDESMIAVMDENGNQVDGCFPPSSEYKMHRDVYKMRNDIGGVVHSHAPFLTAFAMCGKSFCFPQHAEFTWDHKCAEVLPYGRPGSEKMYAGAEKVLASGRNIFLLANHGVVTVGKTLWDALNVLESAESAAKIYAVSRLVGEPAELPEGEAELLLNL